RQAGGADGDIAAMTSHLSVPVKSACALSILLSATALSGPPAAAGTRAAGDGVPTARVCAELGFGAPADEDDRGGGGRGRAGSGGFLQKFATGLAAPDAAMAPPAPYPQQAPTGVVPPASMAEAEAGGFYDQPVNTEKYPDATPNPIR